jgi:hypothetical protein
MLVSLMSAKCLEHRHSRPRLLVDRSSHLDHASVMYARGTHGCMFQLTLDGGIELQERSEGKIVFTRDRVASVASHSFVVLITVGGNTRLSGRWWTRSACCH